ncbi:hypothetical protein LQL77_32475, partial [Rhodococcus cerastii]|nr:hypothetical protein [Rhodococcus cerastii]
MTATSTEAEAEAGTGPGPGPGPGKAVLDEVHVRRGDNPPNRPDKSNTCFYPHGWGTGETDIDITCGLVDRRHRLGRDSSRCRPDEH